MIPEPQNDRRSVLFAFLVAAAVVAVGIVCGGCDSGQSRNVSARPTLLIFGSVTCRDCVLDYPVVEEIAGMGLVSMHVYMFEDEPEAFVKWDVRAMPIYILTNGNREVYRTGQAGKMKAYIAKAVRR